MPLMAVAHCRKNRNFACRGPTKARNHVRVAYHARRLDVTLGHPIAQTFEPVRLAGVKVILLSLPQICRLHGQGVVVSLISHMSQKDLSQEV